ncbi:ParB/RepB/Spo0J family partition protein [Ruegeria sp. EL01]|uniref:ParB/RepB/Spo0J family partition protein n=1 Tax=Ruegeria sp. EL01 TaxID=2107578 RepID=UPI000EA822F9|nr:ParB/RepB/Spo0J family partition protein [Ruegeria sp. EL01]
MARSLTSTLDKLAASGKLDKFTTDKPTSPGGTRTIEISWIFPDPDQPRRVFDGDRLKSLADSIAEQGVLQPITVQPANADGQHLIIMGERRWRAAQLAELTAIPAIIREPTDELRAIQLTENVQRADLTTMEIAQAVDQMRKDGKKRPEIARALGWNEAEVSRFAAILAMPDLLQDLAQQNVPSRALADLNALWKKDESAVQDFVSANSADEISRVSVANLRTSLVAVEDAPQVQTTKDTKEPVTQANSEQTSVGQTGSQTAAAVNPTTDVVAILCRHGDDVGRILTDRKASTNTAIMVSFKDGARIEEISLSDIQLTDVIEL